MEELNILFAMSTNSSNQMEEKILSFYKKTYNKSFIFSKEYYLQGVLKSLGEKQYQIVVLNENLEKDPIQPQYIDMLTDNYDVRVILVINDIHRGESLCKTLYAMGCYDCIFKSEFSLGLLVELIEMPRKKKDAKIYYNLDDSLETLEDVVNTTGLSEIPEDELEHSLDTFNNATEDDIEELFDLAEQTYSFTQMVFLISTLNDRVLNLMENAGCRVSKYQKALNREVKKASVNQKVKIVEKVVEKVVEKKVLVPAKPIKEVIEIEKEVVKEVYKTPTDYKKVIAIIGGARNVGATTIVNMLAEVYSKENKKVSIIDFTSNRDLFERHIFNSGEKVEPLQSLLKGLDKPFKINKNISLYTSSINSLCDLELSEYMRILNIVKMQSDIVIIDIDLKNILDIYSIVDKAFLIVTQNVIKSKELTNTLDIVLNGKEGISDKLQFIINKYINDKDIPSDKDIIECNLYKIYDYLDTSTNLKLFKNKFPILRMNFDISILVNSYKGVYSNLISNEEAQLYQICNSIYPLTEKRKAPQGFLFRKLLNR